MNSKLHISGAVALLASTIALSGCSTSGLAVRSMVPILENSKTASLASADLRTFRDGSAANLVLIEGLIETDPNNRDLRVSASMLYFSYAFMMEDERPYASTLYLRGLEHGTVALLQNNKKLAEVWDAPFSEFELAVPGITDKDLEPLVWTVGNWAQFMSLHLDSTRVLLDIPRVTALLDRAVEIDGSFFQGLPLIIRGALHAFRPPMTGGDPEASEASFQQAFAVSDRKFLLAQYMYARFYCYRILDDELFETTLQEVADTPDDALPEYKLLNILAKQRSARLMGEKDDLF